MISYLSGTIVKKNEKFSIVLCGGVGYKVFMTKKDLDSLPDSNTDLSIWTFLAVRENSLDLYGFIDQNELIMFEHLIEVSGIGPKTALSILSSAGLNTLEMAIIKENPKYLTEVSGVGKKNAEKIVMELAGKITASNDNPYQNISGDNIKSDDLDVIEALKSLGYSALESRNALQKIDKETKGTNNKLKHALKILGRK